MKNNMIRRGFTLVEVMIVVAIIAIIAGIAVPAFMQSRQTSRVNAVIYNLEEISQAKDQLAMSNGLQQGDAVDSTDVAPSFLHIWPTGPVQGTYLANPIGSDPTFNSQNKDWYVLHCTGTTADSTCTL